MLMFLIQVLKCSCTQRYHSLRRRLVLFQPVREILIGDFCICLHNVILYNTELGWSLEQVWTMWDHFKGWYGRGCLLAPLSSIDMELIIFEGICVCVWCVFTFTCLGAHVCMGGTHAHRCTHGVQKLISGVFSWSLSTLFTEQSLSLNPELLSLSNLAIQHAQRSPCLWPLSTGVTVDCHVLLAPILAIKVGFGDLDSSSHVCTASSIWLSHLPML